MPRKPPRRWRIALWRWPCFGWLFALGLPAAAETLNLAGEWQLRLDPANVGLTSQWETRPFPGAIRLPGSLQYPREDTQPDSTNNPPIERRISPQPPADSDFLLRHFSPTNVHRLPVLPPARSYVGPAWYAREVEVPGHWLGRRILLTLERCLGDTRLWVDGEPAGSQDGRAVAHVYDLSRELTPGPHRLVLRVDNSLSGQQAGLSSGLDPGNGITGRIELTTTPKVWIEDVQVFPSLATKSAKVVVAIRNRWAGTGEGSLTVEAISTNTARVHRVPFRAFAAAIAGEESRIEVDYPLGADALLWEETSPALYQLRVAINGVILDRGVDDQAEVTFGLREFKADGAGFTLNGRPTVLCGPVHGPLTPPPVPVPMEVEPWRHLWRAWKTSGLNHARFRAWCPPAAAFQAADEIGIFLAPELDAVSLPAASGREDFLHRESTALLRQFGNHPSFVMMTLTPESGGDEAFFRRLLGDWQNDTRRLFDLKVR